MSVAVNSYTGAGAAAAGSAGASALKENASRSSQGDISKVIVGTPPPVLKPQDGAEQTSSLFKQASEEATDGDSSEAIAVAATGRRSGGSSRTDDNTSAVDNKVEGPKKNNLHKLLKRKPTESNNAEAEQPKSPKRSRLASKNEALASTASNNTQQPGNAPVVTPKSGSVAALANKAAPFSQEKQSEKYEAGMIQAKTMFSKGSISVSNIDNAIFYPATVNVPTSPRLAAGA